MSRLVGAPTGRLVDAQDHPADVLGDRDGENTPSVRHDNALVPRRVSRQVVHARGRDLEPAQSWDRIEIGGRPRPDDDLDVWVSQRSDIERIISADVVDLEVGRSCSQALYRLRADLDVKDETHRVNDSAAGVR